MKEFLVRIPIAGSVSFVVLADDEKEAVEEAWKAADDWEKNGEIEWEFHDKICSGNVLHVSLNQIEVDEL